MSALKIDKNFTKRFVFIHHFLHNQLYNGSDFEFVAFPLLGGGYGGGGYGGGSGLGGYGGYGGKRE